MHRMTSTLDVLRAGIADDMTDDDNSRGYERDETDSVFRQLVDQLVGGGRPTAGTGRGAGAGGFFGPRRVLLPTTSLPYRAADEACGLCGYWTCRCLTALQEQGVLPFTQNTMQCERCGGRFGFTPGRLWKCDACTALGL
ncbi:hypothetical protein OG209_40855 (plasmid) [Streptomyces sp. NBC_01383]|uniref:hypothetical protein n=1 Tax=Streptomyces sp. NBC_01383 TaxID=2903846 RepID=UPI003253DC08